MQQITPQIPIVLNMLLTFALSTVALVQELA